MNKKITIVIILIVFLVWFSGAAFAHGLKLAVEKSFPCVQVTAAYHGGRLIPGAAVKIFFKSQEQEFQQGRTDKNGTFAFTPDKEGTWLFQVDDGMGHRKTIQIEIDGAFLKAPTDQPSESRTPPDASPPGQTIPAPTAPGKTGTNAPAQEQPDSQKNSPQETRDACIYCQILLGLAAIFLCTFLLYAWKRKTEKKNKKEN